MSIPSRIRSILNDLFRRSRLEQTMDAELRSHIQAYAEDLVRAGVPRKEAERRARLEFGNLETVKEECREARGLRWPDELRQDVRYAFRALRRSPGFTLAAVLSLAIGIGVNTTIFTVVSAALIRPLPYADPGRLLAACEHQMSRSETCAAFANANYFDLRANAPSIQDIAAHTSTGVSLIDASGAEQLMGRLVTGNTFALLGVPPQLGRTLIPEDGEPGKPRVILLSYALWQRKFSGDPSVVGRLLNLDGKDYLVTGVMPPSFRFPGAYDEFWLPLRFDAEDRQQRSNHNLHCIGRLKRTATIRQAQKEASFIAARLRTQYPDTNAGIDFSVTPLHDALTHSVRTALIALLVAVGLLLLIACANVGSLILTRTTVRRRELAVRAALGAGRLRLIRQMLTESLTLSALGAAAVVCLCLALANMMRTSLPPALIPTGDIRVDAGVLCFALAVSIVSALLCGLAPAVLVSRGDLRDSLCGSSRSATVSGMNLRVRGWLVASEAGLTVILLIGAGLLLRSFIRLTDVDPGFRRENVLLVRFALPQFLYPSQTKRISYYGALLGRVQNMSGVQSAALITCSPLTGEGGSSWFIREGRFDAHPEDLDANNVLVSDQYFSTMGIPIRQGRTFSAHDGPDAPLVAVINESMAQRFWPGESPVGKRFQFYNGSRPWVEIVGVVGNVHQTALNVDSTPEIYRPFPQEDAVWLAPRALVIRARVRPASLESAVRRQFQSVDKSVPIYGLGTMDELLEKSVASRRLEMLLVGVFGCVALLLASIGIYGVVSYSATQRSQEVGIRVALGATRADVTAMMLRKGLAPPVVGVLIGVAAAFPLARLLASELYQVNAADGLTFSAMSLLMLAVAGCAAYFPSRRAARIDPMSALRQE